METIKRIFGYVHIILGLAVAAQFVAVQFVGGNVLVALGEPIWDREVVNEIWPYLNYLMAVGAIGALVFSWLRVRDADGSDLKEWIASSTMLIASAGLFLLFFEQWFAWSIFEVEGERSRDFRSTIWVTVDVIFPVINVIVGTYLLRVTKSES